MTIVHDMDDRYLNLIPINCPIFRVVLEKTTCGLLIVLGNNVVHE
jgi:hypothetical protein